MRRGKVELKRIEDKTSRQVCFLKRRNLLFKKAEKLFVLCDVNVALFVLSFTGKLYDFSSENKYPVMVLSDYFAGDNVVAGDDDREDASI